MKGILILIAILISTKAFSQKLIIDKADEFTGSYIKETSYHNLASKAFVGIKAKARSTNGNVVIWLHYNQRDPFFIPKDALAYLLLEDKNSIKITSISSTSPEYSPGKPPFYYSDCPYEVSKEDIPKLKGSPVAKIRMELNKNEYVDFESVKERNKWVVRGAISLVE